MATILFDRGDIFTSENVGGLVLGGKTAIVVHGDNRSGWKIDVRDIPPDATPTAIHKLSSPMQLVLRGAAVGSGIQLVGASEEEEDLLDIPKVDFAHIHFEFEGNQYQLPIGAQYCPNIQLPDGRILSVEKWLSMMPPIPSGLSVVRTASIPVAVQV